MNYLTYPSHTCIIDRHFEELYIKIKGIIWKKKHFPPFPSSLRLSLFCRPKWNENLTRTINAPPLTTHHSTLCFHSHSPMQDLFGSVRRSLVFRTTPENNNNIESTHNNHNNTAPPPPFAGTLAEKINSCIRKSKVFSKPFSPPVKMAPPIRWRKGELIGCGAFGRVYMGMNLDSGELLAVKQVHFFWVFLVFDSNCHIDLKFEFLDAATGLFLWVVFAYVISIITWIS